MTLESFALAILSTLVQQVGPAVVTAILDVLDGKGDAVIGEIKELAMRIVADLQQTISTDAMRAAINAMETSVDAVVDVAEEAKLAQEEQK